MVLSRRADVGGMHRPRQPDETGHTYAQGWRDGVDRTIDRLQAVVDGATEKVVAVADLRALIEMLRY
jgi:hypothetical protein